jgi:ribonuclease J
MPDDILRIIPLGGMGEVGRNLTVIEFNDQIVVVDCGLMFPQSDMPGVDLVVPNFAYLTERPERVLGYLITHGHEDHIGALPYVLPEVPAPIFATRLTRGLIEVRLKEHGLLKSTEFVTITPDSVFELGPFRIEPFRVSHSIPDAVGYGIDTPLGLVVHTGEYKFDLSPVDGQVTDLHKLAEFGRRGVLALLSDSTNSERPGHTPSEATVREALVRVFERAEGRIIIATFASNISRLQEIINVADRFERQVGMVGRSMEQNTAMALSLGYLHAPAGQLVKVRDLDRLPDSKVVICCTGTQGEPTSALVRMANDDHRDVTLKRGDTVVLSASPIPGNEELVHRTLDNLFRHGAHVVYQALTPVHVSGHASREEQKLMLRLVAPRYFVPMGGEYRMLVLHADLARELGMPTEDVFVIENGEVLAFDGRGAWLGDPVPGGYVYVDGLGVGDIGQVVLRDRNHLARDGFVVVVVAIDGQTGALARPPEVLTRGFVYLREAGELIEEMRQHLVEVVQQTHVPHAHDVLSDRIRDDLAGFIYDRTRRRPMVLPVVLEV